MNTFPTSLPTLKVRRPAFRVICAWCQQDIRSVHPDEQLTADSHGICPPCARRYFEIDIERALAIRAA
jgi:hypothetical protein